MRIPYGFLIEAWDHERRAWVRGIRTGNCGAGLHVVECLDGGLLVAVPIRSLDPVTGIVGAS